MSQSVNTQVIENIILLAKKYQVQSLELAIQDWRVRVDTQASSTQPIPSNSVTVINTHLNEPHLPQSEPTLPHEIITPTVQKNDDIQKIVSPMPGIFYSKASPEMSPFVEIGQYVQAGDVVCIVEAMKIMYEVKAEKAGIIQAILLENGAVVEYGQALFELAQS